MANQIWFTSILGSRRNVPEVGTPSPCLQGNVREQNSNFIWDHAGCLLVKFETTMSPDFTSIMASLIFKCKITIHVQ